MTISRIIEVLEARLLTKGADCTREVHTACGSDMMSDVLAYVKDQAVLLTGLNNPQVVRTADMMDMICIVFVRGKAPDEMLLALAEDCGITRESAREHIGAVVDHLAPWRVFARSNRLSEHDITMMAEAIAPRLEALGKAARAR